jgi:sec-independent protein translocase protein TatA
MKFLGLGMPELLIILAVALLIFGPKNLPKLGASLGKTVKSMREGMSDSKDAAAGSKTVVAESTADAKVEKETEKPAEKESN